MPSFPTLPSPLDALLTHNERPSNTEEKTLRVLIASKRTHKTALASQIEALRALLDPLIDENVEIDTQIGQLETALAPVRRLPPEIVQEIFLWTDYSVHSPPWHLGQICQRLVSLCARWRELILFGRDPDVLFGSLRSIHGRLASLESLHIQYYSETAVETDLFTGAAKLYSLRYMVKNGVGPLPWGQIKEAYVEGELHFHINVLAQAHNLVNLRLNVDVDEDGLVPGTYSYAVLPSLRILRVTGGRALDALTAPTLQRLDLPAYELDGLSPFLMRSTCPLEVLSLEDDADAEVPISLPSILGALRLVPTLKILFLVPLSESFDSENEPFHRVASFAQLFNALTLRTRDDDDEKSQDGLVPRLSVFALSIGYFGV
ncbi:hypothetical protein MKEN_00230400 [Mycena kentingensis (nom. inval.)]|nr:hypothetical protein MKEN_00230400 [Mycena kentingensis (nom. inval.)]